MQAPGEAAPETDSQAAAAAGRPFCGPAARPFVLVAAILASALGFIDGSILAVATPVLRADLGASLAEAQWISNAYALALSALILAGGAAGDRFGLRRSFVAGIVLFVAASSACALAPGASSLILFRAVQGIGAAIMVAAMGSLAAWVYAAVIGDAGGLPGFGEPAPAGLAADREAARQLAGDAAFSAVATVTAVLCMASALVVWMTVPGASSPWGEGKEVAGRS